MKKIVAKKLPKLKRLLLVDPGLMEMASLRLNRVSDRDKITSRVCVTYEKALLADLTATMTPYLKKWSRTGDCSHLVRMLQQQPITLFSEFMVRQIFHLRKLLKTQSMEEAEEEFMEHGIGSPPDDALPYGVKPAAISALHHLLAAWVHVILPGAVLAPPKEKGRPAHRPRKSDPMAVLLEYNGLREELDIIQEESPSAIERKRNESQSAFIERMTQLTQRLHLGTVYSMRPTTPSKGGRPRGFHRPEPMNSINAKSITAQAIGSKGLSKNALIYGLMSHYRNKKVGSIRRAVEWAEQLYPEDKKRTPSTP